MEAVGKDFGNFSFPICNSFKATLHQGKVCYNLHLDSQVKSKEGMDGGLMLLVDTNSERSVELPDLSPRSGGRIRKKVSFSKPVREDSAILLHSPVGLKKELLSVSISNHFKYEHEIQQYHCTDIY